MSLILCLQQLVRGFVYSKCYNKEKKKSKRARNENVGEKLLEVPLSKSRQIYEYMLQIYLSSSVTNPCFTIISKAD